MSEILKINGAEVKIGEDNGEVVTVPIASLQFSNPQVGDKVEVFRDGKEYIVRREKEACPEDEEGVRTINKHVLSGSATSCSVVLASTASCAGRSVSAS